MPTKSLINSSVILIEIISATLNEFKNALHSLQSKEKKYKCWTNFFEFKNFNFNFNVY